MDDQAAFSYPLGLDDPAWVAEINHTELPDLLNKPLSLLKNKLPSGRIIKDEESPIFLAFQYGPFTAGDTYYVHGVVNSNIISVRCPAIAQPTEHADTLNYVQEADTPVSVFALAKYNTIPVPVVTDRANVAFGHYDPSVTSGMQSPITAKLVKDPLLFPALLNRFQQSATTFMDPDGTLHIPPGWNTRFTLSDAFRFRFEVQPIGSTDDPAFDSSDPVGSSENQCTKFAGHSTVFPTMKLVSVQIDEAWQLRWQTE